MGKPGKKRKKFIIATAVFAAVITLTVFYYQWATYTPMPIANREEIKTFKTVSTHNGLSRIGNNWLKNNGDGVWEMYVEGEPVHRGLVMGRLSAELIHKQEEAFIGRIREMIPSDHYLRFLKYFIYWFNRNLHEYIPQEFKEEIFGISRSASGQFDYIGEPYRRMMNYHSAHDIGHALEQLSLVGCSSFGVWDNASADSSLIIGRNFDFYAGDDFAGNKIVLFIKPEKGIPFMIITWGGMIGAVSGMNLQGLTVTLNAARSGIPASARTPVSMLAREMLQYAGNIEEALRIAESRETFISESFLIGSAQDRKAVIIEKTPFETVVVNPAGDQVSCTNHFQSGTLAGDPENLKNISETPTLYRQKRLLQCLQRLAPIDIPDAAAVLRERLGINDAFLGLGNEKALNQFIAHHSVIFRPEQGMVWVSSGPWQSGAYICYNLYDIFNTFASPDSAISVRDGSNSLPADPFMETDAFRKFLKYRKIKQEIQDALKAKVIRKPERAIIDTFLTSNPGYWETYNLTGDWFAAEGSREEAIKYYRKALGCQIPRKADQKAIIRKLVEIKSN